MIVLCVCVCVSVATVALPKITARGSVLLASKAACVVMAVMVRKKNNKDKSVNGCVQKQIDRKWGFLFVLFDFYLVFLPGQLGGLNCPFRCLGSVRLKMCF